MVVSLDWHFLLNKREYKKLHASSRLFDNNDKVTISPCVISLFLKYASAISEKAFSSFVKLWVIISITEREKKQLT